MQSRWMSSKWNNRGILLAIVAGLLVISLAIWPGLAPQARMGDDVWLRGVAIIGLAFIASAFLTEWNLALSRLILISGAAILIVSGLIYGFNFESPLALIFDFLAAILAVVAAILIGPPRREVAP
jgi:hypothetical protein